MSGASASSAAAHTSSSSRSAFRCHSGSGGTAPPVQDDGAGRVVSCHASTAVTLLPTARAWPCAHRRAPVLAFDPSTPTTTRLGAVASAPAGTTTTGADDLLRQNAATDPGTDPPADATPAIARAVRAPAALRRWPQQPAPGQDRRLRCEHWRAPEVSRSSAPRHRSRKLRVDRFPSELGELRRQVRHPPEAGTAGASARRSARRRQPRSSQRPRATTRAPPLPPTSRPHPLRRAVPCHPSTPRCRLRLCSAGAAPGRAVASRASPSSGEGWARRGSVDAEREGGASRASRPYRRTERAEARRQQHPVARWAKARTKDPVLKAPPWTTMAAGRDASARPPALTRRAATACGTASPGSSASRDPGTRTCLVCRPLTREEDACPQHRPPRPSRRA